MNAIHKEISTMSQSEYNQYKFDKNKKLNRNLVIIFVCINMLYILCDFYLYGGYKASFIGTRGIVVPLIIGYFIIEKKLKNYIYYSIYTYCIMHFIYASSTWSLMYLDNTDFVSAVLFTYNIAYLILGICHPLWINSFFHFMYLAHISYIAWNHNLYDFIPLLVINTPVFILVHIYLAVNEKLFKQNLELEQSLKKAAYIDTLTGTYNRHVFKQIADRDGKLLLNNEIIILMLDIDHFKKINDTYGHNVGDDVLKEFSRTLINSVRSTDYVIRWGGEEFVILLQKCNLDVAITIAERIRASIENNRNCICKFTVSIGVAKYEGQVFNDAISIADESLYTAKQTGRNKVVSNGLYNDK